MAGTPNVESQELSSPITEVKEQGEVTFLLGGHKDLENMKKITPYLDEIAGGVLYFEGPKSVESAKKDIAYAQALTRDYDPIITDSFYLRIIDNNYNQNHSYLLLECAKRGIELRPLEVYDKDTMELESSLYGEMKQKKEVLRLSPNKGTIEQYTDSVVDYIQFRNDHILSMLEKTLTNGGTRKPTACFIGLTHLSAVEEFQEDYIGKPNVKQLCEMPDYVAEIVKRTSN